MGTRATSSRDVLVPSGPAWALSHICHFQLMVEHCYAQSALQFGGSDDTQFIWAAQITWWPWLKRLISSEAQ